MICIKVITCNTKGSIPYGTHTNHKIHDYLFQHTPVILNLREYNHIRSQGGKKTTTQFEFQSNLVDVERETLLKQYRNQIIGIFNLHNIERYFLNKEIVFSFKKYENQWGISRSYENGINNSVSFVVKKNFSVEWIGFNHYSIRHT